MVSGDELFSDTYKMKLVDDCMWEVYGKVSWVGLWEYFCMYHIIDVLYVQHVNKRISHYTLRACANLAIYILTVGCKPILKSSFKIQNFKLQEDHLWSQLLQFYPSLARRARCWWRDVARWCRRDVARWRQRDVCCWHSLKVSYV